MLFLFYASHDIAFTPPLIAYPVEMEIFAAGEARSPCTWRCSWPISCNVFGNPIALAAIGWMCYIGFAVLLGCVKVMVYFTYPRAGGHGLEDFVRVFGDDGQKPQISLSALASGSQYADE